LTLECEGAVKKTAEKKKFNEKNAFNAISYSNTVKFSKIVPVENPSFERISSKFMNISI
jgi:hypothetical protein